MKLRHWHTLAVVVVLLAVGCSAAVPTTQGAVPAPTKEPIQSDSTERQRLLEKYGFRPDPTKEPERTPTRQELLEDLQARVAELEAELESLKWTEKEAIAVVQYRLWERLQVCQSHYHDVEARYGGYGDYYDLVESLGTSEDGGCYGKFRIVNDPVLKALRLPGVSADLRVSVGTLVLNESVWSAVRQPESYSWVVQSTSRDTSITWYAYERTGLVVGVDPSAK